MNSKIIIIGKKICKPCSTVRFILERELLNKSLNDKIFLESIYLTSSNKERIINEYSQITQNDLSEFDIPIVIYDNILISKQVLSEESIKNIFNIYNTKTIL